MRRHVPHAHFVTALHLRDRPDDAEVLLERSWHYVRTQPSAAGESGP